MNLFSCVEIFYEFPYYDRRILRLNIFGCFFNLLTSIIFLIGINTSRSLEFSILIALVIIIPISIKISNIFYDCYMNNIEYAILNSIQNDSNLDYNPNYIDIYLRKFYGICKLNFQFQHVYNNNETCIPLFSIISQAQARDEQEIDNQKEEYIGLEKQTELILEFFRQLYKKVVTQHQKSNKVSNIIYCYMSFLIQIYKKRTIAYLEIMNEKHNISRERNLREKQSLHAILQEAEISFSYDSFMNDHINVLQIIDYDKELNNIEILLEECIKEKKEILNKMSENQINLNLFLSNAKQLIHKREQLKIKLEQVSLINDENQMLKESVHHFVSYLSMGDINQKYFLKQHFTLKKRQINQIKNNNNNNEQYKTTKIEMYKSNRFSIVFITLIKNVGTITSLSNNFATLFGFQKDELIGQNINIVIPSNISYRHQLILNNFSKRGSNNHSFQNFRFLLGQNKKGFVMPLMLKLKVDIVGKDDFGISGIFRKINQKQHYMMISETFKISGISENLFKDIFKQHFTLSEVQSFNINKLIPLFLGTMTIKNEEDEDFGENEDDIFESFLIVNFSKQAHHILHQKTYSIEKDVQEINLLKSFIYRVVFKVQSHFSYGFKYYNLIIDHYEKVKLNAEDYTEAISVLVRQLDELYQTPRQILMNLMDQCLQINEDNIMSIDRISTIQNSIVIQNQIIQSQNSLSLKNLPLNSLTLKIPQLNNISQKTSPQKIMNSKDQYSSGKQILNKLQSSFSPQNDRNTDKEQTPATNTASHYTKQTTFEMKNQFFPFDTISSNYHHKEILIEEKKPQNQFITKINQGQKDNSEFSSTQQTVQQQFKENLSVKMSDNNNKIQPNFSDQDNYQSNEKINILQLSQTLKKNNNHIRSSLKSATIAVTDINNHSNLKELKPFKNLAFAFQAKPESTREESNFKQVNSFNELDSLVIQNRSQSQILQKIQETKQALENSDMEQKQMKTSNTRLQSIAQKLQFNLQNIKSKSNTTSPISLSPQKILSLFKKTSPQIARNMKSINSPESRNKIEFKRKQQRKGLIKLITNRMGENQDDESSESSYNNDDNNKTDQLANSTKKQNPSEQNLNNQYNRNTFRKQTGNSSKRKKTSREDFDDSTSLSSPLSTFRVGQRRTTVMRGVQKLIQQQYTSDQQDEKEQNQQTNRQDKNVEIESTINEDRRKQVFIFPQKIRESSFSNLDRIESPIDVLSSPIHPLNLQSPEYYEGQKFLYKDQKQNNKIQENSNENIVEKYQEEMKISQAQSKGIDSKKGSSLKYSKMVQSNKKSSKYKDLQNQNPNYDIFDYDFSSSDSDDDKSEHINHKKQIVETSKYIILDQTQKYQSINNINIDSNGNIGSRQFQSMNMLINEKTSNLIQDIDQLNNIKNPEKLKMKTNNNQNLLKQKNKKDKQTFEIDNNDESSSQSEQKRRNIVIQKLVMHQIKSQKKDLIISAIQFLGFIVIIAIVIGTVKIFYDISSHFTKMENNLEYIGWPMSIKSQILLVVKGEALLRFLNKNIFNYESTKVDMYKLVATYQIQSNYLKLQYYLDQQSQKDIKQFKVFEDAVSKIIPIKLINSTQTIDRLTHLDSNLSYNLNILNLFLFRISNNQKNREGDESNIFINYLNTLDALDEVSNNTMISQEEIKQFLDEQLILGLFLMITISLIFAVSVFPLDALITSYSQKVLKIFSTFSPELLTQMHSHINSFLKHYKNMKSDVNQQKSLLLFEQIKIEKKRNQSETINLPYFQTKHILLSISFFIMIVIYPTLSFILCRNFVEEQYQNLILLGNIILLQY